MRENKIYKIVFEHGDIMKVYTVPESLSLALQNFLNYELHKEVKDEGNEDTTVK